MSLSDKRKNGGCAKWEEFPLEQVQEMCKTQQYWEKLLTDAIRSVLFNNAIYNITSTVETPPSYFCFTKLDENMKVSLLVN